MAQRLLRDGVIQAKLTVNQPGDVYEQEADRIAEQVLAKPAHPDVNSVPPRIQRFSGQATGQTGTAPASVDQALASPGRPLEPALRHDMEQRFGHDFSYVRIHTDVEASEAARRIRARAFTVGSDIVFGLREYAPDTSDGRRLLVHELAHAIQQSTHGHEPLGVAATREYEAERAATQVVDDGPVPHLHKYGVAVACQPSGNATPAKALPAWMSPTFKGPLPGVPVPGYEIPRKVYTKEDADAMAAELVKRNEDNAANVGYFLEQYVSAAVEICGLFVSSEMSKSAKKAGFGIFGKLLKFALIEVVIAIATGGTGVFTKGLSKAAAKTIEFLASRGAGFASDYESDVIEKGLLTADLDKKQQKLDEITKTLSSQVGTLTETMVRQLGDADTTYLGIWLGKASESSLKDLERFRIPELFPRANRNAIRAVIAGAIAGRAHEHYRAQGFMQESYRPGPGENVADIIADRPREVHHLDDNVIIAHMTPKAGGANLRDIQFYSTSRVLSNELVGKASIQSMPTVPLFIVVDATQADDAAAATTLLKAIRFRDEPDQFDLSEFLSSVPRTDRQMQMLVKRNSQGEVTAASGGLAEHAWLYVWATEDADLTQLASKLLEWQQGEEAAVSQSEAMQGVEQPEESRLASAAGLGMKARELLPDFAVPGAKRFIAGYVVSLVPQKPENRFDDAYWIKDNRGLFWKALPHTGWSK